MNRNLEPNLVRTGGDFIQMNDHGDLLIVEFDAQRIEAFPNNDFLNEFQLLINFLEDESLAKVVIFKGMMSKLTDEDAKPDSDYFRRSEKPLAQLSRLAMATLFILDDECTCFSLQFALSCDFRVGTDDCSFGCPEIKRGFLPGVAAFNFSKYVGLGRARKLILGGIPLGAEDAFQAGLLDKICTFEDLEVEYLAFATSVIPSDTSAFKMGRRLLDESFMNSYEAAFGKLLAVENKLLG